MSAWRSASWRRWASSLCASRSSPGCSAPATASRPSVRRVEDRHPGLDGKKEGGCRIKSGMTEGATSFSDALAVPEALQLREEALRGRAFVARLGLAEFLEQLAMLGAELRRGLDLDLDDHVAMAAAVQHRHAGAADAQLLARLDAGGNVEAVRLAVEPRHFEAPAERGGGDRDRAFGEEVRA